MNKSVKILFFVLSVVFLIYVLLPSQGFPNPPEASFQSVEPADTLTPLRRGYYTNMTRSEIISHYKKEFNKNKFIPQIELNYPPEEAVTIIYDQTKSTYLEELVHPFRESIYINGFEAEKTIYELKIDGRIWRQKVIVRYVPSNLYMRIFVISLTLASAYLLMREYSYVKK